jgi:serine/threonine-protein kinase
MTSERWARIQDIFDAALELTPDARAAFVDSACGEDADLRHEVVSLLDAFAETGPIDVLASELVAPMIAGLPDEAAGRRIGSYRLLREIGHGGMGTVFLAEREDADFEQRVALKLVRAGRAGEALRTQFLRERRILAQLQHPHIARLVDGGWTKEGEPFFAMEYIEGQPIDVYCDEHQQSVEQRLHLFSTVCQAVQYAHQNLIVHRDLKPSNILVTEEEQVKLLDFGIAKLLEDDAYPAETRTTARVMTPEYASPEQVRGAAVTTASDVYSLGVVLYELLTGHRPYEVARLSPSEVEQVICKTEPPRPSTVVMLATSAKTATPEFVSTARSTQPETLQRRLAGDLDTIVLKALHKDPARRYASAEQFLDDIKRHLAGLPVQARPDTLGYRASKFVRRHRVGVSAAALLVLTLLAGIGGTAWQAHRATRQAQIVEEERDRARREADKAQAVSSLLVDLFKSADPRVAQGDTLTVYDLLEQGLRQVREDLADQPGVQATMMSVLGRAYRNMGRFDRADSLLTEALHLRQSLPEALPAEVADGMVELGKLQYDQGHFDAADTLFAAALHLLEVNPVAQDARVADVLENLGGLRSTQGALDEAETHYRQALALRRSLYGGEHATVATTLSNLASLMRHKGEYEVADSLYREAVAIQIVIHGRDHLDVANTINSLGVLRYSLADYAGAEPYLRDALTIRRNVLGAEHPEVAQSLNNLAAVLEKQGNLDAAAPLYRESLALKRRLLGNEHPAIARSLNNLALLVQSQGDYEEAERLFMESLAIRRTVLGPEHADVARALHNLAYLYKDQGDAEQAEAHFREALALRQRSLGEEHPDVALSYNGLGMFFYEQGQFETAASYLEEALAIWEKALPAGHGRIADAQGKLGRCLVALRRFEEAESYLLKSYTANREADDPGGNQMQEATRDLVALYETWNRPEEAAHYRALTVSGEHE